MHWPFYGQKGLSKFKIIFASNALKKLAIYLHIADVFHEVNEA